MLVDTHAHLNLPPLYERWREVLAEAEAAGVSTVIVPGASVASSRTAVELAHQDQRIFAAVGIHPEEVVRSALDQQHMETQLSVLTALAQEARVVAIGECGLDYYRTDDDREKQRELFAHQIAVAETMKLPLIVHSRTEQALQDAADLLKGKRLPGVVFHCFSGDEAFWQQIEPMGACVGVGATITYPKNEALRQTIAAIPLERMVLETDAPWLPPQPKRGQTNTPANVTISAIKLAEIKQLHLSQLLEAIGNNTKRLFPRLTL